MPEAITGLDRPVPFGPWPHVGGGQIWTQEAFPCDSLLLGLIGSRHGIDRLGRELVYVVLNNPIREKGNIAMQWHGPPWECLITSEQLQTYLHKHHYHYEGQCYDLINKQRWDAVERALTKKIEGSSHIIPPTNEIGNFMHCHQCLEERPADITPAEWARIGVGLTALGLQVWCWRHQCNVVHIDFEGCLHPANDSTLLSTVKGPLTLYDDA